MLVSWFDKEQTVIHHQIKDKWTWIEFDEAHKTITTMMNTVEHDVSILAEFVGERATMIPSGMLLNADKIMQTLPDNHGKVVIVSKSVLARMALVALRQVIRSTVVRHLVVVSSLEDAYELLGISPEAAVK